MGASPTDKSLLWIGGAPGVNDFRFAGAASSTCCDEIKKWVIESATSIRRPGMVGSLDNSGFQSTPRDSAATIPNISNQLYFTAAYALDGSADIQTVEFVNIYCEMRG
jgi:hypothetical protein